MSLPGEDIEIGPRGGQKIEDRGGIPGDDKKSIPWRVLKGLFTESPFLVMAGMSLL